MIEGRFMLLKSVEKIRVENKDLEVTGKPNATTEIEMGAKETIQFLNEFKFLEESFTDKRV